MDRACEQLLEYYQKALSNLLEEFELHSIQTEIIKACDYFQKFLKSNGMINLGKNPLVQYLKMEEEVIERAVLNETEKELRKKNIQQIKNKLSEIEKNHQLMNSCKEENLKFWKKVKRDEVEKRIDEFSLPNDIPVKTVEHLTKIKDEFIDKIMNQASKDIDSNFDAVKTPDDLVTFVKEKMFTLGHGIGENIKERY